MKHHAASRIHSCRATALDRGFFTRDPLTCARALVGCELLWRGCGGVIVETEAYSARNDEACHTFSRPSSRRFVASHPPGTAYVYLNYGVHWLLNFLVKGGPEDGFVLIRALDPTRGLPLMQRRRNTANPKQLCSGPGKLTQALGIDGSCHGLDLLRGESLKILPATDLPPVVETPRVGISKAAHLPWRFILKDNPHVSAGPFFRK